MDEHGSGAFQKCRIPQLDLVGCLDDVLSNWMLDAVVIHNPFMMHQHRRKYNFGYLCRA